MGCIETGCKTDFLVSGREKEYNPFASKGRIRLSMIKTLNMDEEISFRYISY
jgi:hypothetical protein